MNQHLEQLDPHYDYRCGKCDKSFKEIFECQYGHKHNGVCVNCCKCPKSVG